MRSRSKLLGVGLAAVLALVGTIAAVASARETAPSSATSRVTFYSPTRNLSCEMEDSGVAAAHVRCQSVRQPHSVTLSPDGRLSVCAGSQCLGNLGTPTRVLGYGSQVTAGRFRCLSRQAGVTCTVIASGKGFLINRDGVQPVVAGSAPSPRPRAGGGRQLIVVVVGGGRVISTPAGISCPQRCAAAFPVGTRVVLIPKAKNGFRLRRWGGACRGAGACSVRMTSPRAVTAEFVRGGKTQPPPTKQRLRAEPGSYAGRTLANYGITFFVSAGGSSVLNISIPVVGIACTPPGPFPRGDHLEILKAAIRRDGSFTARASQEGVFAGVKAKFTYSVTGDFQKATAIGAASAAGSFREDIVFTDSATHRCTSNNQSWTVTRTQDPPPSKQTVVESGSYSGRTLANYGLTFSVSAGDRSMTNISIPVVGIACTPPGPFPRGDHLEILKAAIRRDGSFTARASQEGVFAGVKAKFTYSFKGYFQGVNAAGAATAAGSFREDIAFTDSATHTCTSNNQSWTATRSG